MNVTKHVLKGRQLHKEGYPRMLPAEQGQYLEASDHERIAENNGLIGDLLEDRLLERILHRDTKLKTNGLALVKNTCFILRQEWLISFKSSSISARGDSGI